MKIEIITKKDCPKCEYVKRLFAEKKIDLGKEFELVIKDYKDVEPDFFKKYNLQYVPLIIAHQEGTEGIMIMTQGMTKENIEKTLRQYYKSFPNPKI